MQCFSGDSMRQDVSTLRYSYHDVQSTSYRDGGQTWIGLQAWSKNIC